MVEKEASSYRLRPLSPVEARLADLAETWFPEAFARGKFDKQRLYDIAAAADENTPDLFGLSWPGKAAAAALLRTPSSGALLMDHEASYRPDAAGFALCVSDNLEAMKLLQPAYFGRFKMAFVDPPYNTPGDFVYVDNAEDPISHYLDLLSGKEGGFTNASPSSNTHGRWLSMMMPRLFLIRNLLRDDGVVFVVIDDHESHHLRQLMDEIFGEENFVCTFAWEKRYAPAPDAPDVGYVHENIVCYRKSDAFAAALLPKTAAQIGRYKNPDKDPRGDWKPADYTCRFTAKQRPKLYYAIRNLNTHKMVWPKKTRVWACSEETHNQNVKDKLIWWPPDADVPAKKKFLKNIKGAKPRSLLEKEIVGHTDDATKELREVLPSVQFTPKPTRLITHLIAVAGVSGDDMVLEPFASIGTVASAVLSIPDPSKRPRVVSIELPEPIDAGRLKTITEAATARITKLAKKDHTSNAGASNGLRVFRLARTGIQTWNVSSNASAQSLAQSLQSAVDPVDPTRSDNDLLCEIALQAGVPLLEIPDAESERQRIFVFISADVTICLARKLTPAVLQVLRSADTTRVIVLDSAFGMEESSRRSLLDSLAALGKILLFV